MVEMYDDITFSSVWMHGLIRYKTHVHMKGIPIGTDDVTGYFRNNRKFGSEIKVGDKWWV